MKLPITEELDFAYLLELMPPLHNEDEFAWLPELFSIIGHEKLLTLCKYAGGNTIKIPTVNQISASIEALQWFYDIRIKRTKSYLDIPSEGIRSLVDKIIAVYNVRNSH